MLYVATSNAGKLRDFAAAAAVFNVPIAVLPGLAEIPPPVEDADTFEANARLKAVAYSHARPGLMVLADDSGLEVDALDGAPGVRSARFADDAGFVGLAHAQSEAGVTSTVVAHADERNNLYLRERLRRSGVPEPWAARYRCVLAAARAGVVLDTANGTVEGLILAEPRGTGGFGYDPLFWLPEHRQTMAEIDLDTKQTLSHRGRALHTLLASLPK